MKRLHAGCLASPLWVPLIATLVAASTSPSVFTPVLPPGSWISGATVVGAIAGYAGIVAVGLPAHLLLRRRNPSMWAYLASWFGLALAAWAIVFIVGFASNGIRFSLDYLAETIVHRPYVPVAIGAIWALVGMTFWLVVRPDKEIGSVTRRCAA